MASLFRVKYFNSVVLFKLLDNNNKWETKGLVIQVTVVGATEKNI